MKPTDATSFQPAEMHEKKDEDIRLAVLRRTYDLLTAAFSFVAALAWNDAIQSLFLRVFGPSSTLVAKFLYAIILTIIIVWFGSRLARLTRSAEKRLKKD
jgi:hypothetical protein